MPAWGWALVRLLLEAVNEFILDVHSKAANKEEGAS